MQSKRCTCFIYVSTTLSYKSEFLANYWLKSSLGNNLLRSLFRGDVLVSKRLKYLREEKNLLQKDIAKYLNITTSAYGYYEQGKRSPDMETIKKLADFFNVSTDYLLGRTNNRRDYSDLNSDLGKSSQENFSCQEAKEKVAKILIDENIIEEGESIPDYVFEKIIKYGIEATIEILKLEKKLEE